MQKIQKSLLTEAQAYATKFLASINEACTHFHAVNFCRKELRENGFNELREVYIHNI